ncbi:uncharacterized protein SPSK_01669 [Sporothrix schenckii 1099-18]|uniref:Uncharacterized protein n=1 Tax=Sporothrix schenckii 1099-18 TaxID=1397361 RepID=A0A0F2MD31_SPOSC|nr:uncharacterized protein SPSK_01669 [Sporothrix schenckii 1099-18]KJR87603.1 hypothetical protein SPSK_01669 [Sporothrix schenckii 1099-18]
MVLGFGCCELIFSVLSVKIDEPAAHYRTPAGDPAAWSVVTPVDRVRRKDAAREPAAAGAEPRRRLECGMNKRFFVHRALDAGVAYSQRVLERKRRRLLGQGRRSTLNDKVYVDPAVQSPVKVIQPVARDGAGRRRGDHSGGRSDDSRSPQRSNESWVEIRKKANPDCLVLYMDAPAPVAAAATAADADADANFGLGYRALKAVNLSVILASISEYVPQIHDSRAGCDVIGAAKRGLLHITGEPYSVPTMPGVGLVGKCTGSYLHGAILSALRQWDVTGSRFGGIGQHVDTSLLERTFSIMAIVYIPRPNLEKEAHRWGIGHPKLVPYASFPTKDTSFVIGAVNDRPFETVCQLAGGKHAARTTTLSWAPSDVLVLLSVVALHRSPNHICARPTRHALRTASRFIIS